MCKNVQKVFYFASTANLRDLIMSRDGSKQKKPEGAQFSWELTFPVGPLSVSIHVHLAHLSRQKMELWSWGDLKDQLRVPADCIAWHRYETIQVEY